MIYEQLKNNPELWDIFSCKDEYKPFIRDRYDRYPFYLTTNKEILRPIASEHLIKGGLKVKYPHGKRFAICLTHDIDMLYLDRYTTAKEIAHNLLFLHPGRSLEKIKGFINRRKDQLWNLTSIMELEKKYGARSSFYFMALEGKDRDFNYDIEEVRSDITRISDEGWGVGLHGGHNAYRDVKELKKEKERLERVTRNEVLGHRNHFMRFKVPDSWAVYSKAGFKYDSTFGFADCVGFRNGMCHPFKPYNRNTEGFVDILEIPLIVMDYTMYVYMELDMKKSWQMLKNIIDITEKNNGVVTILWHNTAMFDDKLAIYTKLLEYGKKKEAWMTSGEEVYTWWNKNYM